MAVPYQPIIAAAMAAHGYGTPANDFLTKEREDITGRLNALKDSRRVVTGPEDNRAIVPADVDDLAEVLRIQLPRDLSRGVHTLAIRVADEAGNIGSASVTFRVR